MRLALRLPSTGFPTTPNRRVLLHTTDFDLFYRLSFCCLREAAGFTVLMAIPALDKPPLVGSTITAASKTAPELSATAAQVFEKLNGRQIPLPEVRRLRTVWAKARSRADEEGVKDEEVDKSVLLTDLGDLISLGQTKAAMLFEKLDSWDQDWCQLGKGLTPEQHKTTRRLFDKMWNAGSPYWKAVKMLWNEAVNMRMTWKVTTLPICPLIELLQLDAAEASMILDKLVSPAKERSKEEAPTKVEAGGALDTPIFRRLKVDEFDTGVPQSFASNYLLFFLCTPVHTTALYRTDCTTRTTRSIARNETRPSINLHSLTSLGWTAKQVHLYNVGVILHQQASHPH